MTAEQSPIRGLDLEDALGLVEKIVSHPRMGRPFRKAALALADINMEFLTGLVVRGEVIHGTLTREYAACGCKDGRHRYSQDGWFGRHGWSETLAEAEERRNKVRSHIVTHVVFTSTIKEMP